MNEARGFDLGFPRSNYTTSRVFQFINVIVYGQVYVCAVCLNFYWSDVNCVGTDRGKMNKRFKFE